MKICGIVAEYNPFHNGHKYQIDEIKKKTNSDVIIAIMSGNFIQRGLPASFDKWARTRMAIENGVDIVIELPTLFATASAEFFATGAVSILNQFNCVDYISFGVKNDDEELLNRIVDVLIDEPNEYKTKFKQELSTGLSFPVARSKSLANYLKKEYDVKLIDEVMQDPNNILAIEYIKVLRTINSNIKPILIKRVGTDYNSLEIENEYCSSTAIREVLKTNDLKTLKNVIPKSSLSIIKDEINLGKMPMRLEDFESEILYALRTTDITALSQISDVNEGLENIIKKSLLSSYDVENLIDSIKSKRYTRTKIQRILIHTLLNIKEETLQKLKFAPQYARVLGMSKNGKKALSYISKKTNITIVTSVNKFLKEANETQKQMLELDIKASNLYSLGYKIPNNRKYNLDYTMKIVE